MKKNCKQCLNEFDAQRSTATFCSEACRKKYARGTSPTAGMSPEEIRAYKKKEMELNLDELPVIDVETPVENPISGPGVEKMIDAIRKEKLQEKLDNGYDLSDREEEALITDVPEEDIDTRIKKGMRVNVRLTHLRQYDHSNDITNYINICYVPTKEEYEDALKNYDEYEAQFPITNKEHAKTLQITGTHCLCTFCGERFGSMNGKCALTCKYCRTKEQRKREEEATHARNIISYYKRHNAEFKELHECPICGFNKD